MAGSSMYCYYVVIFCILGAIIYFALLDDDWDIFSLTTTTTNSFTKTPPATMEVVDMIDPLLLLTTVEGEALTEEIYEKNLKKERSKPGLVTSVDRLVVVFNRESTIEYLIALTKKPSSTVTVHFKDPSNCFESISKSFVTFSPNEFDSFLTIKATSKKIEKCTQGLIHHVEAPDDKDYHNWNVRIKVDVYNPETKTIIKSNQAVEGNEIDFDEDNNVITRMVNDNEKIGEWIPEEVFESEEESLSAMRAMAPLERSRSAFDFRKPNSQYSCVEQQQPHKGKMHCTLAINTPYATPFYVVDPVGGLDDDGWNGFPVVLIVGGVHGSEPAGSEAAFHISEHWRPRRGRLIIIPWANLKGLRLGVRVIPGVTKAFSDLNRNFPSNKTIVGELAKAIWEVCTLSRPDILFDLHEGWGVYTQLKDNEHTKLVNSKTFSKGSSIITSAEAKMIAVKMRDRMNKDILLPEKKFELISPPVDSGLADKLSKSFKTRALVLETTKTGQALSFRVAQHLLLVAEGLISIQVLGEDFSYSQPPPSNCLHLPTNDPSQFSCTASEEK